MWAIKTDRIGDIVWQKTFGGSGLDFGFDVLETENGGIVLIGETASTDFPGIVHRGKTDAVMIRIK